MIRKQVFLISCSLLLLTSAVAQQDSLSVSSVKRSKGIYLDYVVADQRLLALSDSGKVVIWDLLSLDTLTFPHNTPGIHYTSIAADSKGLVYLSTKTNQIYMLDPHTMSIWFLRQYRYQITRVVISRTDELVIIYNGAVYSTSTDRYWTDFDHSVGGGHSVKTLKWGLYWKRIDHYFANPHYQYVDSRNRLWMLNCLGEFGGSVQLLDLSKGKILDSRQVTLCLDCPRSVFEDTSGNIYITSGLQHFGNNGSICRVSAAGQILEIFNCESFTDSVRHVGTNRKLFIRSGCYNPSDHSIWLATSMGIYASKLTEDGLFERLVFKFSFNMTWNHEQLAVGYEIPVKKMDALPDGRLLLLTDNDGIGIYDHQQLVLLK